jgi:hypothetical protein
MPHRVLSEEVSHCPFSSGQNPKYSPSPHTVIEQYTKNVRFCILCNYVNKITPAIQSRCTKFRFSPLPEVEVEKKVDQVVEREK